MLSISEKPKDLTANLVQSLFKQRYCFQICLLFTSLRIAHRRNKIVVLLKLLPSRAFPVDGRRADLNDSGD